MCSAVRKASLSTITYHNLKFLFLLVKYTNRELVLKDKDRKYAFFENDPKIDPFRESCVIMRQDSLAFILVVGSKRRNQRFDDRLVTDNREEMIFFWQSFNRIYDCTHDDTFWIILRWNFQYSFYKWFDKSKDKNIRKSVKMLYRTNSSYRL